jgi:hypothetical protein
VGEGVFSNVVSTIAAILFLLTAWAIITGKHDRYYRQFRRHGIPPDKDSAVRRRITKGAKTKPPSR